jgi:hypothetical protein
MCVIGMIFGQTTFAAGMTHVLRLYKLPQLVTCVLIAGGGGTVFPAGDCLCRAASGCFSVAASALPAGK